MGLREDLQADIAEAFDDDLADAVTAFTGARTVVTGYNPVTEEPIKTVENYSGRGVFGSYSTDIADGINILLTDTKLTALQNELIDAYGAAFTPAVDDKINGLKVISIGKDPAGASWSIQLRKA
jgi:hypothetical protein